MCSLWRENYSKDTHRFLIKLLISILSPTLLPSISLSFLPSNHKKMEAFALLSPKSSIFVGRKRS